MTTVSLKIKDVPENQFLRTRVLPNEDEEVIGKQIIRDLIKGGRVPPNTYMIRVKIEVEAGTFEPPEVPDGDN